MARGASGILEVECESDEELSYVCTISFSSAATSLAEFCLGLPAKTLQLAWFRQAFCCGAGGISPAGGPSCSRRPTAAGGAQEGPELRATSVLLEFDEKNSGVMNAG